MKRTILSLSLAALVLSSFSGVALAQGVAYSAEQKAKAEALYTESQAAIAPLMQQVKEKKAELNVQMVSANPDKAKIESLSKEIGALQGKIRVEQATLNSKLTKEGLSGYANCPGGMGMGMHDGMGMGRHGGKGEHGGHGAMGMMDDCPMMQQGGHEGMQHGQRHN